MYFDKNKINFSFYSTEKLEIVCEMILKSSPKNIFPKYVLQNNISHV